MASEPKAGRNSVKMEHSAAALSSKTSLCPTCLSIERSLRPLGAAVHVYNALAAGLGQGDELSGALLTAATPVCWECRNLLQRALLFHLKTKKAHAEMLAHHASTYTPMGDMSYSTLTKSTKLGFDYELEYARPLTFPYEVKIEADRAVSDADDAPTTEPIEQVNVTVSSDSELDEPVNKQRKKNVDTFKKEYSYASNRMRVEVTEAELMRLREEERRKPDYAAAPHKCDTCIKGFRHKSLLERHNSAKHNKDNGSHPCDICNVYFPTDIQMANHRLVHFSLYQCAKCVFKCHYRAFMATHYALVHEADKSYSCLECGKTFPTKAKMAHHRKHVHNFAVCKCEHCGKDVRKNQFKRHLLMHTAPKDFECEVCHKSYRGQTSLYTHMNTYHAGDAADGSYCVECNFNFVTKNAYVRHLRTSEKHNAANLKFACSVCKKKFLTEAYLKQHRRRYHIVQRCDMCEKTYKTYGAYWTHFKRVHQKVKLPRKYMCDACGNAFTSKTLLTSHIVSHTGERPHECDVCGARFGHKSTLYTHNRFVHLKLRKPRSKPKKSLAESMDQ